MVLTILLHCCSWKKLNLKKSVDFYSVLIQLANIGPLLVTLYNYFSPRNQGSGHCDVPISYLIIGVGIVSCLLMALFWDRYSKFLLILNR